MPSQEIHPSFQLNGNSFLTHKALIGYSKKLSEEVFRFFLDWFDEKDHMMVTTSGSTGIPKAMKLKKQFMINSARATGNYFSIGKETKALLCLSNNFIAGKMMLVRALTLGWRIDVIEPTSTPLESIEEEYDFSAMVPLQLNSSINKLHKIKKLIVGGGFVSRELEEKIQDVPTAIYATYGMTETVTHIAVRKLNHNKEKNREIQAYKTLQDVTINQDDRGCLVINAPSVTDEELVTNDIVKLLSETSFQWLGRYDNVINSGGVKLYPEQIEKKLSTIIQQRFFITSIPDAVLGQKLVLAIEGIKQEAEYKDLIKQINVLDTLKPYEKPKSLYYIPQFFETPTQKIQRKRNREYILAHLD